MSKPNELFDKRTEIPLTADLRNVIASAWEELEPEDVEKLVRLHKSLGNKQWHYYQVKTKKFGSRFAKKEVKEAIDGRQTQLNLFSESEPQKQVSTPTAQARFLSALARNSPGGKAVLQPVAGSVTVRIGVIAPGEELVDGEIYGAQIRIDDLPDGEYVLRQADRQSESEMVTQTIQIKRGRIAR